jgi:hypothetical protein
VRQIIPLPEANDITIQLKKKAQESRIARKVDPDYRPSRLSPATVIAVARELPKKVRFAFDGPAKWCLRILGY